MSGTGEASPAVSAQGMVVPLALAQFIASFAATNMNVAISTIANDIGTTVIGMQTTITLFTLTMAALMIPGSKLTEILGPQEVLRRRLADLRGGSVAGGPDARAGPDDPGVLGP